MKIAAITCHDVYNYGASLQAYALQQYCKSLGCEYEIINYKPDYLSNHHNLWAIANSIYNRPILKQLYLIAKLPGRLISLKSKRKFDQFTSKYLQLTPKRYESNEQLSQDVPLANLYIAGSDQIWNTLFKNGGDLAFYLDFARGKGRRISYAASFATDGIYNGLEEFVRTQINSLDAVSVRELSGVKLANSFGRNDANLVADPVFLLSKHQWENIINYKNVPKKDYILVYDCERSPHLKKLALRLKQLTGLPIFSLTPSGCKYADKDYYLSGPIEFISLMNGAEYVVANSFHALAFSLIFEKQFYLANRSENINTRMLDLLSYLEVDNRLILSENNIELSKLNYNQINKNLNILIDNSKQYICDQIKLAGND